MRVPTKLLLDYLELSEDYIYSMASRMAQLQLLDKLMKANGPKIVVSGYMRLDIREKHINQRSV